MRIGNTPLLDLENFFPKVRIFAKDESTNPSGSMKDRAIDYKITKFEKEKSIKKGDTLFVTSSGNTGKSLAKIGTCRGYKAKVLVPNNFSEKKRELIRDFGGDVILYKVPKGEHSDSAILYGRKIAEENGWVEFDQFSDQDFVDGYRSLGKEIVEEFKKMRKKIDYFIAGVGTGATLIGAGTEIKRFYPNVKIIGVEPEKEPTKIEGLHNNHLTNLKPFEIYERNKRVVDKTIYVEDKDAYALTLKLNDRGLLVGPSSGANLCAALKISQGNMVIIFHDTASNYSEELSVFRGILNV